MSPKIQAAQPFHVIKMTTRCGRQHQRRGTFRRQRARRGQAPDENQIQRCRQRGSNFGETLPMRNGGHRRNRGFPEHSGWYFQIACSAAAGGTGANNDADRALEQRSRPTAKISVSHSNRHSARTAARQEILTDGLTDSRQAEQSHEPTRLLG